MCVSITLPSFAARLSLAMFSLMNVIHEELHKVSRRGIAVGAPRHAIALAARGHHVEATQRRLLPRRCARDLNRLSCLLHWNSARSVPEHRQEVRP
jgi:hypothetical protein